MDDCTHYVCTTHFAFTPLDDFTHLRCYYTPTVSFVFYHFTFLRISVRFYGSLCFYTTGRFYASKMLLYADCQFCFTPLCDSTHLRCYRTPTASFVLRHCTFLRIYVSTAHFAFTALYDSTHLRWYCTPTVSFVLYHRTFLRLTSLLHDWTILRIYDATVRRLSVLFYTTVRFYPSTFLRLTLHRNSVLNRNPG